MNFESAKVEFIQLYNSLPQDSKCRFARWVGGHCEGIIDEIEPTEVENTLNQIGDVLRQDIDVPGGRLSNEIVRKYI